MSWMAPRDELGDRREPVGLGNSVGSDVDAALTFKTGHGRVVNEPLDRAAREREFDADTELHCVNLSPENRFEASPLRGNSTSTGTCRRHFCLLVRMPRPPRLPARACRLEKLALGTALNPGLGGGSRHPSGPALCKCGHTSHTPLRKRNTSSDLVSHG